MTEAIAELSIHELTAELAEWQRVAAQRQEQIERTEKRFDEAIDLIVEVGGALDGAIASHLLPGVVGKNARQLSLKSRKWLAANSCASREAAPAEAEQKDLTEANALLRRIVKYAREDRACTPGCTRLARALGEAERLLSSAEPASLTGNMARTAALVAGMEGILDGVYDEPATRAQDVELLAGQALSLWTYWCTHDITDNDDDWAEFTNAVHGLLAGKSVPKRFLGAPAQLDAGVPRVRTRIQELEAGLQEANNRWHSACDVGRRTDARLDTALARVAFLEELVDEFVDTLDGEPSGGDHLDWLLHQYGYRPTVGVDPPPPWDTENPGRCSECDPSFGCFNGSSPCSKTPSPPSPAEPTPDAQMVEYAASMAHDYSVAYQRAQELQLELDNLRAIPAELARREAEGGVR